MRANDGEVMYDAMDICYDCAIRKQCMNIDLFRELSGIVIFIVSVCSKYKRT